MASFSLLHGVSPVYFEVVVVNLGVVLAGVVGVLN
jgi:hypothetical protein